MPRFDKTGPLGKGPKTGRGKGKCDSRKVRIVKSKSICKKKK